MKNKPFDIKKYLIENNLIDFNREARVLAEAENIRPKKISLINKTGEQFWINEQKKKMIAEAERKAKKERMEKAKIPLIINSWI